MNRLSIDELLRVREFSARRNFERIRPLVDYRDLEIVQGRKCLDLQDEFEELSGVSMDRFVAKLRDHHKNIDDLIDVAQQQYTLTERSRKYFHTLLGFIFDLEVVKNYIKEIIIWTIELDSGSRIIDIEHVLENRGSAIRREIDARIDFSSDGVPELDDVYEYVFGNLKHFKIGW